MRRPFFVPAAAAVLSAALAAPAANARTEPPALAGRTVVTAAAPRATLVRLPFDVTVSPRPGADVSVSGGGSFAALSLVRAGAGDGHLAALTVLRLPSTVGAPRYVWGSDTGPHGEIRLESGNYWLTVAPGGRPVTFTLRLRGLSGTRTVTPRQPVRSGVRAAAATTATNAAGTTYGTGQDATLRGPGLLVSLLTFRRTRSSAHDEGGVCHYTGTTHRVPAAARFAPFCPGATASATGSTVDPYRTTRAGDKVGVAGITETHAGAQAQGVWVATGGGVDRPAGTTFFVEYAH
jgi:hypothetical protein